MADNDPGHPHRMLYGPAIHASVASNDLDAMKRMRDEAEQWLTEYGDLSSALEVLKAEIAKKEAGRA